MITFLLTTFILLAYQCVMGQNASALDDKNNNIDETCQNGTTEMPDTHEESVSCFISTPKLLYFLTTEINTILARIPSATCYFIQNCFWRSTLTNYCKHFPKIICREFISPGGYFYISIKKSIFTAWTLSFHWLDLTEKIRVNVIQWICSWNTGYLHAGLG